jgi:hypothetical protein
MTILSMFAASAFGICVGDTDTTCQSLRHYDGTIGDSYRVRLTIAITGNEIEGVYFYATQLKDIPIRGKIVDGARFVMDELDSRGNVTGHFEGEFPERDPRGKFGSSKLQCEVMVGWWFGKDGAATKLPFYLTLEGETGGTLTNQYAPAGAPDDELVHRNARCFWEDVKQGDKKTVASLISYPIRVNFKKGPRRIRSARELVENYDAIFSSRYVDAISKALPRNMFVRDQGIMLGRGEVWFGPDGKVIALNNF